MTGDNSNFYQHIASLQGILHEREIKQYTLSQEFNRSNPLTGSSSLIDRQSSLYQYWQKILENERKSDERNRALLKKWEDLEQHIAVMAVKTEKLKLLKEEYFSLLHNLYLHGVNQRENLLSVPSSSGNYRRTPVVSEILKERQYASNYLHNQRLFNRTPIYRSSDGSLSQTLPDSGLTLTRSSYSEPDTPRTIHEASVQTENPVSVCHSCGQKIPATTDTRNAKPPIYSSETYSTNHGVNTSVASPPSPNKWCVGVERFAVNVPPHSSPFYPVDKHIKRGSSYNMHSGNDHFQNTYQNNKTESVLERHPPSSFSSLKTVQKHTGTQYSPYNSSEQKIYLDADEDNPPYLDQCHPEKAKMQFGTLSTTLSNVSSISSQNEAMKVREIDSKTDLGVEETSILHHPVSDETTASKGIKHYSKRGKQIPLKGKSAEEFKNTVEDIPLPAAHHKAVYPPNVASGLNVVVHAADYPSDGKSSVNLNMDKMTVTEPGHKIPAQTITSNSEVIDISEHNKMQSGTNQELCVEEISNQTDAQSVSLLNPIISDPKSLETKETEQLVQSAFDIDVNHKIELNMSGQSRKQSDEDVQYTQEMNSNVYVTEDLLHHRRDSILSEKSLSSTKNLSANESVEDAIQTPSTLNSDNSPESEWQSKNHKEDENESLNNSASNERKDLKNASLKYKADDSSGNTDDDEKLNESDDSFFDKEVPLTATTAYQMLLGGGIASRSATNEISNSDSDDVENELAAAVLSETTQQSKKDDEVIPKVSTRTTELSSPFKNVAAVENSPSKSSSLPVGNRSVTTSVFHRTTRMMSKATRKALSLDLDSDSDEAVPPAATAAKSTSGKQDEDSDEFDFYD